MISVIIPHYGDPTPTLSLVAQLRGQETTKTLQIIVADDASPQPFPATDGVEVVRRATNGGFGSAVNSGASRARGETLLILNSDLEVSRDFVAQMTDAAARFPQAVLSPRVVDRQGWFEWTGRDFPRIRHQVAEWLTPLARWRDSDAWHRAVGHNVHARVGDNRVDWVVGAAMLVPADAFKAVGGFDERFFMNSEEVDLQRRLRNSGVHSIALASPSVVHAGGGSSPSAQRRQWIVDSRFIYARKWSGASGEWRLRLALLTVSSLNFAWNAARSVSGRDLDARAVWRSEVRLALRRPGTTSC